MSSFASSGTSTCTRQERSSGIRQTLAQHWLYRWPSASYCKDTTKPEFPKIKDRGRVVETKTSYRSWFKFCSPWTFYLIFVSFNFLICWERLTTKNRNLPCKIAVRHKCWSEHTINFSYYNDLYSSVCSQLPCQYGLFQQIIKETRLKIIIKEASAC